MFANPLDKRIFSILHRTLSDYEHTKDHDLEGQLARLQELEVLAHEWLSKNGATPKKVTLRRRRLRSTPCSWTSRGEIEMLSEERSKRIS